MTTQIAVPEVAIELIDVVEGFNSRRNFDPTEIDAMAETIKVDGLVQPIRLRPKEDGRFDLVAGERRFRAAKKAGLMTVPFTPSTGTPRVEAFLENDQRVDLDPIEYALDLKAVGEELGLTTIKDIAKRFGTSKEKVGEHLRLLKLPESVQVYIAARIVPVSAEPKLRRIAKVSPEVATWICEVAKREGISGTAFVARFAQLVEAAGASRSKQAPTMLRVRGFRFSEAVKDPAKRKELSPRVNALLPSYYQAADPQVEFDDVEVDAARAAGCLVEYQPGGRGRYSTALAYITDVEFAADLIEQSVERREKEAEEAEATAAASKSKQKNAQRKLKKERERSGEKSPQAKAKERKAIARRFNDSLKVALLKKRTPGRRRKYALARAKAIGVQLISDNPDLAARGLRLVSDQLQEVKVTPLKKGGSRVTVEYADRRQSTEELLRRMHAAKDPLEVIEVLSEALLAGIVADGEEFPSAAHVGWHSPAAEEITKLMATEIKEVRPPRRRKP